MGADWVSAIATVIVAAITAVYVWLTHKLTRTNQELVAAQTRLRLGCDVEEDGTDYVVVVNNFGPGIALDAVCSIRVHEQVEATPSFTLAPNHRKVVSSPMIDPVETGMAGELVVELNCKNELGEGYFLARRFRWNSSKASFEPELQ